MVIACVDKYKHAVDATRASPLYHLHQKKKSIIMPHSTAPVPMLPDCLSEEDVILPDAPEETPGRSKEEGNMDINDGAAQSNRSTSEATRTDVRLEDLFNDVEDDEDDEFSGSAVSITNEENISPDAPL